MKKLKFITASAAIAALTLTACQNDVDFTQEDAQNAAAAAAALDDNAIQFGTYLNQNLATRAGKTGNIDTEELQKAEFNGFGVFAYYTPESSDKYTYWNSITASNNTTDLSTNYTSASSANFMFNQQVTWTGSRTGYIGATGDNMWAYTPLKYWPNDFINDAEGVDDQENDANDKPANGSGYNGTVSFFAYAPYVDFSTTATNNLGINHTGSPAGTAYGITAINGQTTLDDANNLSQDPILTYVINPSNSVDLLWGTANNTSVNVNNVAQAGGYTGYTPTGGVKKASAYPVNINLTKQKTNGTINFAFKHALSRVGGSTITPGTSTNPNGLMVILDIDDQKGAETGGIMGTTPGIDNNTKVTIKSISISYAKIGVDENEDGNKDATEYRVTGGELNLATGQWTLTKDDLTTPITHIIKETNDASTKDADLVTSIAEPATKPVKSTADAFFGATGTYAGVTGVPQTAINVYGAETNPFLFIPNTFPILDITVDYFVRTKDGNLAGGFSEVENVITKRVTFNEPVKMNKQYNLLMHIGLTSVKFTAEVSNWILNGDANENGVIDATEEVNITDVFVPRNVSGLMATYNKTKMASTDATAPSLTEAKYFVDNIGNDVTASVTLNVTNVTPAGWVTASGNSLTISANTSFTDRTATVTATNATPSFTSEPVDIIQYGRVATTATITWGSEDPTSGTIAQAINSTKAFAVSSVTASGFESDNTGAATATTVTDQAVGNTEWEIVFIDNATGKKATWLEIDGANFKATSANNTGANRTAKIYLQINGKLVPTAEVVTQAAS